MLTDFSTITELISARVKLSGDQVGFRELDAAGTWQPVTWNEFAIKVDKTAGLLYQSGVRPGDKVAVLLPNCLDWQILHYAILRIGAILVAIERFDSVDRQIEIFENAEPIALF